MTGKIYYLAEDIYSTFNKGYLYGKKGEEVTVIAVHGHVLAVQGNKEKYSVPINKLILKTNHYNEKI